MTTMTKRILCTGTLAALTMLGACKDASSPAQSDALLTNAATVVADATIEDATLAMTPFGFGLRAGPALAGGHGTGPLGGAGGIGGSLSGTRSVTFYDADGYTQAAYDSLTTASIHVVFDLSGDVTRGGWSAGIDRTRDWTVSGLEGHETTRTFNGSGTETVSRSRTSQDGTQSSFDINGSITYDDVVVPVPGSDPRWPLSGTITRTMTVNVVNGPNGDVTRTVDATVTFDGTSTATAVVNGRTIQIDLTTRPGRFPFRGGFGH